jgi:hypothetical protein
MFIPNLLILLKNFYYSFGPFRIYLLFFKPKIFIKKIILVNSVFIILV